MRIGAVVPQGCAGDFADWAALPAWTKTVQVAQQAEQLGFESLWLFDHFETVPKPIDAVTFESFAALTALAVLTSRVRLGLMSCAGFRNPAVVAKMISTMDVISAGRMELGITPGSEQDECMAYGYGSLTADIRLADLSDALEVVVRMLAPGHATFEGVNFKVDDAINEPKGVQQPRIPIVVGGDAQELTWRLAAKYADELNLGGLTLDQVREALPVIRDRCHEWDRDASTLDVSVTLSSADVALHGQSRIDRIAAYGELGVARILAFLPSSVEVDDALELLATDARAAGVELDPTTP